MDESEKFRNAAKERIKKRKEQEMMTPFERGLRSLWPDKSNDVVDDYEEAETFEDYLKCIYGPSKPDCVHGSDYDDDDDDDGAEDEETEDEYAFLYDSSEERFTVLSQNIY